MVATPAPALDAPSSKATVKISAIDSTMWLVGIACNMMYDPPIKGFDRVQCGAWSFLIEHPSGRKLLYDLGCRKDWRNLPPALGIANLFEAGVMKTLDVQKNIADVLTDGGLRLDEVEGVIWSHWYVWRLRELMQELNDVRHFDHTGDPSTFPSSTKLIVGPGFKEAFMPGYPTDPTSHVLETDFQYREVMEVDFDKSNVKIGRFKAYDYFGDGSFYILDSPGHAVGHVNALARTHASPDAGFVHLGGDSTHHAGEMRPTIYLPFPDSIEPSPVPNLHSKACPGDVFTSVLRGGSKTSHILEFQDPFKGMVADRKLALIYDEAALRDFVAKDEELDASKDVFTVIAHDWSLKGVIDEWPKSLNDWREKGLKESTRWKFLEDFAGAVISTNTQNRECSTEGAVS